MTDANVLSFDGRDDLIELPTKKSFRIKRELTIEAWIKVRSQVRWAGILSKVFDSGKRESGYGLLLGASRGLYFAVTPATTKRIIYLTSQEPADENWHHVAGVFDGELLTTYVDGEPAASQKIEPASIHHEPNNQLSIGAYRDDNERYFFSGQISEVRLWNVARSQQQLQADMGRRLSGSEKGLVGYWPLDEGSGESAHDKTKRASHGVILGGATWEQDELPLVKHRLLEDEQADESQSTEDTSTEEAPRMADEQETSIQKVLNFDGGTYVDLPPASVPTGNEITLSVWAFGAASLPINTTVFEADDAARVRTVGVHVPWNNGHVYFDCGHHVDNRTHKAAQPANYKGSWSHWAFVKDASAGEMKIYLNGELWQQAAGMNQPIAEAVAVGLGAWSDGAQHHYQGRLAEVRVWNRARTQKEIQRDMHRRLSGDEPNLYGYWPLDEGTGDQVHDRSSRGNHGVIHGNADWQQIELPLVGTQARRDSVAEGEGSIAPESTTPPGGAATTQATSPAQTVPPIMIEVPTPSSMTASPPTATPPPMPTPSEDTATGLTDYTYWWRWRQSLPPKSSSDEPPFRRGRIWA